MDITFGVIPTIVLAFQSYRLGRNLATEYKTFNDDLRRVLTDIATTTAIFKHTIDQLVGEIAGNTPELTFEYLGSGKWDKDDLNAQLEGILGSYFDPLKDSMSRTHETIKRIGDLLLLMTGTTISVAGKKNKISFLRWPNSVAPVTPPIEIDPLQSEFKTIQIQSTRKKLLSVANDHLGGLKGLLDELRTHKDTSRATLKQALRHVSRSTAGSSTEVSRISPCTNNDNPNCDITRTCLTSRTVQAASQTLYRMISQAIRCECHSTHLCLDRQVNNTATTKSSKGKSKQQPSQTVEPEPHFSFRMTVKSNDGSKKRFSAITPPLRLVFIGHSFQDTDSSPTNSAIERRICEELSCSNKLYEKKIRDSTGSGSSGFLLRRATFSDGATKTSNSVQVLSLENLVESQHRHLYHLDRFLIAINLAAVEIPEGTDPIPPLPAEKSGGTEGLGGSQLPTCPASYGYCSENGACCPSLPRQYQCCTAGCCGPDECCGPWGRCFPGWWCGK